MGIERIKNAPIIRVHGVTPRTKECCVDPYLSWTPAKPERFLRADFALLLYGEVIFRD